MKQYIETTMVMNFANHSWNSLEYSITLKNKIAPNVARQLYHTFVFIE